MITSRSACKTPTNSNPQHSTAQPKRHVRDGGGGGGEDVEDVPLVQRLPALRGPVHEALHGPRAVLRHQVIERVRPLARRVHLGGHERHQVRVGGQSRVLR